MVKNLNYFRKIVTAHETKHGVNWGIDPPPPKNTNTLLFAKPSF